MINTKEEPEEILRCPECDKPYSEEEINSLNNICTCGFNFEDDD